MSLADLQTRFMGRILDDDTASLTRGEAVYHFAYRNRLAETLGENFERVWAWLGDEAFRAATTAHMRHRPPSSWTLDDFGEGFDETLSALYPQDPEIGELAWLDWALRRAFSGPDAPQLDAVHLAQADWSTTRLVLAPTFRLRPLRTNVVALWQALAHGEAPPVVQILTGEAGLAVWRNGLEPVFRTLDHDEYAAVQDISKGAAFAAICEDLAARYPDLDTTEAASQWLRQWITSGMVCGVS